MTGTRSARRPPHFDQGRIPYFATTRTQRSRVVFTAPSAEVAVDALLKDRDRYGFLLLAFAFMPDHAHFVIVPSGIHSISNTMRIVEGSIARRVNDHLGRKGPLWQEGFYDKGVRTIQQLNTYIEYTHRNPVAAGLVARDFEYPYSSADGRCAADYQRFFDEETDAD